MRRVFEIGGIVAAVVLVGFGIAAIVMGANGRSTVNSTLSEQKIVGTPDMTPTAIKEEAAKAGLKPPSFRSRAARWPKRRSTAAQPRAALPST